LISFAILAIGLSHYRVPRIVAARMVINSLIDSVMSSLPVVGNLFDVYFKADTRNVRLLREYVARTDEGPPSTLRHWAVALAMLGGLVLVVGLLVVGAIALIGAIAQRLQS